MCDFSIRTRDKKKFGEVKSSEMGNNRKKKPNKKPSPATTVATVVEPEEIQKVEDHAEAKKAEPEPEPVKVPEVSSLRKQKINMSEISSDLNKLDLNKEKA